MEVICVRECGDEEARKVNYGSSLLFSSNSPRNNSQISPEFGREFSFMLTVSSLREIHPPMVLVLIDTLLLFYSRELFVALKFMKLFSFFLVDENSKNISESSDFIHIFVG